MMCLLLTSDTKLSKGHNILRPSWSSSNIIPLPTKSVGHSNAIQSVPVTLSELQPI